MVGGRLLRLARSTHLVVVSLVLGQNLLSHLLLPLVDIRIELISIFSDREFLVVINRNENLFVTNWLFLRIMELSHVRVLQCLLSRKPLSWIEIKEVP